eukprot:CAMPEP_0113405458 /NCGR_PEP_ID=MMETSP0013_2-20120614/18963_1 /TAXON_ID=2843 ORGANISM="Skeletonema costatum, Strain 1716" /NCGR_SAMPLE_ID=MMETSP0013_2 /ASSEMBLY_ACC=CAM_ASM_000158 /LENGTH=409 /DNA_ID=CAMNT_0000291187 /DNA_START=20 /DNA_END=1249 /DNA_ORIENTATION=- /assembly_acc=CAM_ASM_000158
MAEEVTANNTLPHFKFKNKNHIYRDFSTYIDDGGKIEKHKKSDRNFPARLHAILSDEQYSNIISWMPHGRAWKVLNKTLFVEEVIPKFFGQSKFASFARQLSGWGFKRLRNTGPDFGCYYHECFLQGHPRLTVIMKRISPRQGKATPNMHSEPDFNTIAKLYLPEKSADAGKKETAAAAAAAAAVPRMESSQPNHQRDPYYQRGPTTPPHQAAYAYAAPANQYDYAANQHTKSKSVGQYHSSSSSGVAPIETTVTNPNYLDSHIFSSVHQDQAHQEDDTNQYYYGRNINQYAGRSPHSGHFSRPQYHYSQQQQHDGHSDKKFQNAHGDRNSYHSNYSSAQGLIEGNIQPIGSSGGTVQMRMSYPAQAQGIQARNSFLPSFSPIRSNFQEVEEGVEGATKAEKTDFKPQS